jgi:hypothetical protein
MTDDRILMLRIVRQQVLAMQCCLDTAMTLLDAIEADSPFSVVPKESPAERAVPEGAGPETDTMIESLLPPVFGRKRAGETRPEQDHGGGDAPMFSMGPDGIVGDPPS